METKVGFFSIGLDTYWAQFEGLRDHLLGYHAQIGKRLAEKCEVVDAGLVDTPDKARAAAGLFADANIIAVGVGSTAATMPSGNPFKGKYQPVCSVYLEDTSLTGYS
ncbi:MAG: arabinose isomerase, partial [Kiritimatiellae bacterium]|nr:arabinose isomerase [Kiritimatiellia bacterium]